MREPGPQLRQPVLSVVVAAINGCQYLDACLAALAAQRDGTLVEVIVVQGVGSRENMHRVREIAALVRRCYPWARLVHLPAPVTLAQLRAAGIGCAAGEIVAITEDHCIPAADWCTTLVSLHKAHPAPAIGGAVDNAATQRLIDWAVFWCEYSPFVSPVSRGPAASLAAANVSYKRVSLTALGGLPAAGYREGVVHAQLVAAGMPLWSDPALRVWHKKHFTVAGYCRERFAYSRWYAGLRRRQLSTPRRLLSLGATPLLPAVLLLRLGRRIRSRPQEAARFVAALPYLLLFVFVWALGEAAGTLWDSGASEFALR